MNVEEWDLEVPSFLTGSLTGCLRGVMPIQSRLNAGDEVFGKSNPSLVLSGPGSADLGRRGMSVGMSDADEPDLELSLDNEGRLCALLVCRIVLDSRPRN